MRNHIIPSFVVACMPITESLRLGDMSKGEPLPEGVYPFRIVKMEVKKADPTEKNPDPYSYAQVTLAVIGDERVDEALHGRYVFDNLTFDPKANHRLRKLAIAIFGENDELDVLEAINEGKFIDAEVLGSVVVTKGGKGKDGNWYEPKNNVTKYVAIDA